MRKETANPNAEVGAQNEAARVVRALLDAGYKLVPLDEADRASGEKGSGP